MNPVDILSRFLMPISPHGFHRSVFASGKYAYATDGAIAARMNAIAPKVAGSPNNIDDLFKRSKIKSPTAFPFMPTLIKCPCCDGKRCKNCNGLGARISVVKIRGSYFDARYLAKLVDLPGIVLNVSPIKPEAPMYFTFDGGDGLLMPRRTGICVD